MHARMMERKENILKSKEYKMSRKEAVNKVSIVVHRLLEMFTLN